MPHECAIGLKAVPLAGFGVEELEVLAAEVEVVSTAGLPKTQKNFKKRQ